MLSDKQIIHFSINKIENIYYFAMYLIHIRFFDKHYTKMISNIISNKLIKYSLKIRFSCYKIINLENYHVFAIQTISTLANIQTKRSKQLFIYRNLI